jgi:hypothetical protein
MAQDLGISNVGRGIVNHPWLFFSPVVIIMSLLLAYSSQVNLYRSNAQLAFEYVSDTSTDPGASGIVEQKKLRRARSILVGEPLHRLIRKAWPEINPKENPVAYNSKVQMLRSNRGLELEFRRDNPNFLTVGFTARTPQEAFLVTKAAVDTLVAVNEEETRKSLERSRTFLTKERDSMREKLAQFDSDILRLRRTIPEGSLRRYDQERILSKSLPSLVSSITPDSSATDTLEGARLRLTLVERELERLNAALKEVTEGPPSSSRSDNEATLQQLSKEIFVKEQQLNALVFKGFKAAHPQRRSLEAELDSLRALREQRANEYLEGAVTAGEPGGAQRTQRVLARIESKQAELEELREKVRVLESYQDESKRIQGALDDQIGELSKQTAKLAQLDSERALLLESYNAVSSKLESIEREGRVEEEDVGFKLTVLEKPRIPTRPLPLAHLPLVLMGVAVSLATGLTLSTIAQTLDSTVSSAKELQRIVSVPILGSIDAMVMKEELKASRRSRIIRLALLMLFAALAKPLVQLFF